MVAHYTQIGRDVVIATTIDVMDNFARLQFPTEYAFRDDSVLESIAGGKHVSIRIGFRIREGLAQ